MKLPNFIRRFIAAAKIPIYYPTAYIPAPRPIYFEIARLDLRPGDTLVVKIPQFVNRMTADRYGEKIREHCPNNRVLVITKDTDLAVLSAPKT